MTKTTFGIAAVKLPTPRWAVITFTILTVVLGIISGWANQTELLEPLVKKDILYITGSIQGAITIISPLLGIKKEPVYKS